MLLTFVFPKHFSHEEASTYYQGTNMLVSVILNHFGKTDGKPSTIKLNKAGPYSDYSTSVNLTNLNF